MNRYVTFRATLLAISISFLFFIYIGCGGSDEATYDDAMVTDTGGYQEGGAVPEDTTMPMEEPQQTDQMQDQAPVQNQTYNTMPAQAQPTGPSADQLQSELDSMKTENIQLQDQLATAQQNNQDLMSKISDLEAANMAMKKKMEEKTSQPVVAPMSSSTSSAPGKTSPELVAAYKGAVSQFNSKDYTGAMNQLQGLLGNGVKTDYADNCHYWLGLCNYQTKNYKKALGEFEEVLNYKFSEKRDDAQMMIARTYARMGNRERATEEYKKLVEMYPTSEYVARAKAKIQ